jgi:hypothetical protein
MELKPDRNMDTAAFIAAVEQNRLEMQEAYRQVEKMLIAREVKRILKAANLEVTLDFNSTSSYWLSSLASSA